ncbi:diguanylate cyclase [Paraburkholderia sp. DHOC27]|uniref:GGDEF domain-containing protein n=1 Tax=Paraburkholderia sp. DHOC27 TaxID=2303330 RepID=UPI000E3E5161|nr:sensor domain-containing diguanylate cyclase [Paraburkholderia sp. DHOC27]RFU46667.1 sensor domain-containing diguanylate cyclase [Paraburkholderia sp. DHOC27]
MLAPTVPANESARLDTLRALSILDTPPEERFDRLTRLAKRIFGVPIALVSLVDENRQWFKSCVGLPVSETPRDVSFCAHAILDDGILMVPDTLMDVRFHDNPLVTGAPGIRFYAGCPLTVPNGSKLGTLCLIDVRPRALDDEDRALLHDLSRMAGEELAAAQLATLDPLTQLSNRRGFEALSQHALNVCKRLGRPASLLFFDLNEFKAINDTYGHAEGDRALVTFAEVLREALRESDVIARLGGDEFVALLTNTNRAETQTVTRRLQQSLALRNEQAHLGYQIRYSVGEIEYDATRHTSIADLLAEADAAMYVNKRASKK